MPNIRASRKEIHWPPKNTETSHKTKLIFFCELLSTLYDENVENVIFLQKHLYVIKERLRAKNVPNCDCQSVHPVRAKDYLAPPRLLLGAQSCASLWARRACFSQIHNTTERDGTFN